MRASSIDGTALLAAWAKRRWLFLAHDDPAFPAVWRGIASPPSFILIDGDPARLAEPLLAVIGTRRATPYGSAVAQALAHRAAALGVGTVSGLAVGIDTAAHVGSLDARASTVAILPSGFDRFYPEKNLPLAKRIIASGGAVVTEVAPDVPARSQRFIARNRLIVALARAVIVVEAGESSGTRTAVAHALDQGRDVFAVPGPIFADVSRGTNRLIADGATPLWDLSQIDALFPTGDENDPILLALSGGATSLLELQERLGIPPSALLARVSLLEIAGRIRRGGDKIFPCG